MRSTPCAMLLLAALTVAGCAGLPTAQPAHRSRKTPVAAEYRVGADDVIELNAGRLRALASVGGDGRLDAPEVPDVWVQGLTAEEVAGRVAAVDPRWRHAEAQVREHRSRQLYVFGLSEDQSGRPVPYRGSEPLTDLLRREMQRELPYGYRVRVVRSSDEIGGEPVVLSRVYDASWRPRGAQTTPVRVAPDDVVYVEKAAGKAGPLTRLTDPVLRLNQGMRSRLRAKLARTRLPRLARLAAEDRGVTVR